MNNIIEYCGIQGSKWQLHHGNFSLVHYHNVDLFRHINKRKIPYWLIHTGISPWIYDIIND